MSAIIKTLLEGNPQYPIQTNLDETSTSKYLESVEEFFLRERVAGQFEKTHLIGQGTSGTAIGVWLMTRNPGLFEYIQIVKPGERSHRDRTYPNEMVLAKAYIIDDFISSGATLMHILMKLQEDDVRIGELTVVAARLYKSRAEAILRAHPSMPIKEFITT
jgi:hypothetical protein